MPRQTSPETYSQNVKGGDLKPYTEEEMAILEKRYTPAQIAAIKAGEEAIDPEDLATQGAVREDPWALQYQEDDLSRIQPVIDKAIRAPEENYDPKRRFKNEDEVASDLAHFIDKLPEQPTGLDYQKFVDQMQLTVGKEEAERNPVSYVAPEIPKNIPVLRARATKAGEGDIDPATKRLMRQTGFSNDEIRRLRIKVLWSHRVVNQTKMGKIQSIYYLTIAGNQRGLLGIGEGKSTEPEDAMRQAKFSAIRNMQPVPRYEERTIYGDIKVKVGAVELELMTRPPGFGIRCQPYIFEMCRCLGISDMAARVTRSRNPMNVVKATLQALQSQRLPEDIARGLGRKLVDVRKVYYGGSV